MQGDPFVRRRTFLSAYAATSALASLPARSFAAEPAADAYDLVTTTGTIYGTLERSAVANGPHAVALLIAGSGPTDRDDNSPSLALQMYRKLATALAEHGIASVRYDKRGIAASHAAVGGESDLRFETYVDDATAYVAKLRADHRFDRVTVIGHSEGSLIGMIAARRASASAFVSIAGAGFPAADVLVTQLTDRLASKPDLLAAAKSIIAELAAGRTVPANRPARARTALSRIGSTLPNLVVRLRSARRDREAHVPRHDHPRVARRPSRPRRRARARRGRSESDVRPDRRAHTRAHGRPRHDARAAAHGRLRRRLTAARSKARSNLGRRMRRSLVSSRGPSPIAIAATLLAAAIIIPTSRRIAKKAGYDPRLGYLMIVSPINLVLLIRFAAVEWPIERELRRRPKVSRSLPP